MEHGSIAWVFHGDGMLGILPGMVPGRGMGNNFPPQQKRPGALQRPNPSGNSTGKHGIASS